MSTGKKAARVVYPAMFGALAVAILYLGTLVPTGVWGVAALAGLLPAVVFLSAGLAAGLICWVGVTFLAFLLLPDKLLALLFGTFFGIYPIVKGLIERMRKLPLEYILKLAFFNGSLTVAYLVMRAAVFASLPAALSAVWALYLAGNIVFLLYDYGVSKLISLYMARIHRHLGPKRQGGDGS